MHRRQIWDIIRSCDIDRIIITHGTDTITQTASFLSARTREQSVRDLTIVLTGAFLPESFKDSDADFNIGVAIGKKTVDLSSISNQENENIEGAVGALPAGVYVGMNGKVFH